MASFSRRKFMKAFLGAAAVLGTSKRATAAALPRIGGAAALPQNVSLGRRSRGWVSRAPKSWSVTDVPASLTRMIEGLPRDLRSTRIGSRI